MIHVYECKDAKSFILTEKPHAWTLVNQGTMVKYIYFECFWYNFLIVT